MAIIIGVKFKGAGKIYYFDPDGANLNTGDYVVVETPHGIECGTVTFGNREISDEGLNHPLKKIIRPATAEDIAHLEENRKKEERAYGICLNKINEHGLKMKLVTVEYTFDNNKILFYFTADGRVDFRELVKDLAGIFRTRIELRQIGVRDESKMLGGLGICGREFCCKGFLADFQPVSIKMAKEQGMSLNPVKISGTCGRLMCCLKYEQEAYSDLLKKTPKIGAYVITPDGKGTVVDQNIIKGVLNVQLQKNPDSPPKSYKVAEVKIIKDGQIKINKSEQEELKGLEG